MNGTSNERHLRADLTLVLITAFWGSTFMVVKGALEDADAFSFLALRFGIGALAVLGISLRQRLSWATLRDGLLLGGLLYVGFALQTWGLVFTTAARSAFITGLSVILVPFVSIALFRTYPSPPALMAVGLAVLGLYRLTGLGQAEVVPAVLWKGDLLTLGCAVAYSFHISLTERYASRHAARPLVGVQLATVCLLSVASFAFARPHVVWSPRLWQAVLFSGLVASAGCIVLQTWAQARTTAVRAALVFALEPVFTAVYVQFFGQAPLHSRELEGGALIVLGVVVGEVGSSVWRRRRSRAPQPGTL